MSSRTPCFVSNLSRDKMALILAEGRGSRLHELTRWRAKPVVFFGGKFRIIDYPLSNCVNSNIRDMGGLTQYRSHSLIRHLVDGWSMLNLNLVEFIEVLPASQQMTSSAWYQGTADAVYQNLDIIQSHKPRFLLVLAGDHVYKIDDGLMLAEHVNAGAQMTVACFEVPRVEASAFGVMRIDEQWRVREFAEKPADPKPLPSDPNRALASMGIYVFYAEYVIRQLYLDAVELDFTHDFGHDIIPRLIAEAHVQAYPFRDPDSGAHTYWRDVGTIDSFWTANLELLSEHPELDLYHQDWPIFKHQPQPPPARFLTNRDDYTASLSELMMPGACVIDGQHLRRVLLFSNVRVGVNSVVEASVMLPDSEIRPRCVNNNAVLDRGCKVPTNMQIGVNLEDVRQYFHVSDGGVVMVTPQMLEQIHGSTNND